MVRSTRRLHHARVRPARNPRQLVGRGQDHLSRSWRTRVPWVDIILALVLFGCSLGLNLASVDTREYHPDESRWLNRAYYIEDFADPFGKTWQDYYLTRGQPPLGSYLIGIGQLVQGGSMHPNNVWDFFFDFDKEWNPGAGAMPSDADLDSGRRTSAVTGACVVFAAFFLFRMLTNRIGGVFGAVFLLANPLHIWIGSQALSDQLLNLLLVLSFITAYRFAKSPTWLTTAVLGILLGLGGAAKLTPLLLTIPIAGLGMILLLRFRFLPGWTRSPIRDRKLAVRMLAQPLIAFATFVTVYPYLWVDPIGRTFDLFNFRSEEMASQGQLFDNAAVPTREIALGRIGYRLGDQFQTFNQIQDFVIDRFNWTLHLEGIDMLVGFAGALLLVLMVFRTGLTSPLTFVTMLSAAEGAAIVIGLRSDLYRYYLPLILVEALSVSVTAGVVWSNVLGPRLGRLMPSRLRPNGRAPDQASLTPLESGPPAVPTLPLAPRNWKRPLGRSSPGVGSGLSPVRQAGSSSP